MRYSLVSRFQGAICGSFIGESLSKNDSNQYLSLSFLAVQITQSLIVSGKLTSISLDGVNIDKIDTDYINNVSEAAIAFLPLGLFCHESPHLLKQQLSLVNICPDYLEDLVIWNYAIALFLKEKLDPTQGIKQILHQFSKSQTPLIEMLELIQTFLDQGSGLDEVVHQLLSRFKKAPQTAMAIAFYCFSYIPEDFRLCLLIAHRSNYQPQLTAALTGALAGVYNSFVGIPLSWRLANFQDNFGKQIYQNTEHLYAAWCGVYQPDKTILPSIIAVASTSIIQRRSSLKIISQKENWQ